MPRIQTGEEAIDFKSLDYLGQIVDLNSYRGSKVLLSFFRGASCPFCNMRVRELIVRYDEFVSKNIEVLVFFAASSSHIQQYAGNQHPPFKVIPDPKLYTYKKYGIETKSAGMLVTMLKPIKMIKMMGSGFFNLKSVTDEPIMPADFLIDENLIIQKAYYGKDFGDHLPIDVILNG